MFEMKSHTGISYQNFFHSTIIPPWRVSWVFREADKLKELKFYLFGPLVFQPKALEKPTKVIKIQ